ncbi:MAG: hypothetical protein JXR59_02200 [Desulfuromonadaceae bacterium]|nr:hypothetical protein [Desulfuromonadaceae bacterium]
MKRAFSQIVQLVWALAFLLLLGAPSSLCAAGSPRLRAIEKQDEVNLSRFILEFNVLPEFEVRTSGQKVEVTLHQAGAQAGIQFPGEDGRLLRVLAGQDNEKLVLSFLLRRPPYFVNATKNVLDSRIVLDVHWQANQGSQRPAIARALPGHTSIDLRTSTTSQGFASRYQGHWEQFLEDYEQPLVFNLPLRYSLPPFPILQSFWNLETLLPDEVKMHAATAEWSSAIKAFGQIGFEAATGESRMVFVMMLADLCLRDGNWRRAGQLLRSLDREALDKQPVLARACQLTELYLKARRDDDPYALLAEIALMESSDDLQRFEPFLKLLQAEAELSAGRARQALLLLGEGAGDSGDPGLLHKAYALRRSDAVFLRGDVGRAIELYRQQEMQLAAHPFSLANFAQALFATRQYEEALQALKTLLDQVDQAEQRDHIRYAMALCLLHAGDANAGLALLHQILPGTTGALLAQAKVADLSAQVDDERSRLAAHQAYVDLTEQMPTRAGRAEMQFKQAVALHLLGRDSEAVAAVQDFLKTDRLSSLVPHAHSLLAEILPGLINQLVADENYFDALLLVEQNRELLVASQRNYDFLIQLGEVFSQLEFADRAIRLYLYLLDATGDALRREATYPVLLKAFYQQQDFERVCDYARRYGDDYPQGAHRAEVCWLHVQALLALGDDERAQQVLDRPDRPRSIELDRLAAQRAWQRGELAGVEANLDRWLAGPPSEADAEDLFMQAEAWFAQGQLTKALAYYRILQAQDKYQQLARYRIGMIELRRGNRRQGLMFLRQVAETEGESPWKKLATETLAVEAFDLE